MEERIPPLPKYQSNNLRILLLAAGVVILLATPSQPYINVFSAFQLPTYIATIVCVVCAGIINRRIPHFFIVTGIITLALLVIFQLTAIIYFTQGLSSFVAVDEFVALLLFFSAYYSFRSYREIR